MEDECTKTLASLEHKYASLAERQNGDENVNGLLDEIESERPPRNSVRLDLLKYHPESSFELIR